MQYLAFDTHINHCELCVRNGKGEEIDHAWIPTEANRLIEAIQKVPGPKTVAVEEGCLADWMKRLIEPHVTRFVICNPKHNRWIAADEGKDDRIDAQKLSHLLWGGFVKEVHHPCEQQQRFKELVLHYHQMTKQVVRCKNILKAKFRQHGIGCAGSRIYAVKSRPLWIDRLSHPLVRAEVEGLYAWLDATASIQAQALKRLRQEARPYPQIGRFCRLPGIGLIHACTFFALVDTPHRFAKKSKLWTYCGLGIKKKVSSQKVYRNGLCQNHNRLLKATFKRAAQRAVRKAGSPFQEQFDRLCQRGISPEVAQVVVARSLASVMWGMWRSDQDYQPEKRQMPCLMDKAQSIA